MKTRERTEEPNTAEVLLTRTQAARRMGVSVSTIRRMEGEALDPIVLEGKHYFRAEELARLRPSTQGEIAARAFTAFNEGRSVIDTVIELEQPPEVIEALHDKWRKLSECLVIQPCGRLEKFKRLFESIDYPVLTPYLVQQCLLIVAKNDDNRERLRRAVSGEPLTLD